MGIDLDDVFNAHKDMTVERLGHLLGMCTSLHKEANMGGMVTCDSRFPGILMRHNFV